MKRIITFLFLIATSYGMSQVTTVYLEHNNVSTMLMSNGSLGYDPVNSQPAYEVPKGSGKHPLYMFSPIFTAQVDAGYLIGNYSEYSINSGGFMGPIVNDYSDPWHLQQVGFSHMHDSVIDNHFNNWMNSGYVPSLRMEDWPAYGNSTLNSSPYMAPFYDVNNDDVYTPEDGDYPLHFGEESFTSVYNYDSIVNPNMMNAETRAIEVNYSAYQVNSTGLENVTFIMHRVTNKSNETLIDFQWGIFADFDIGGSTDDYLGTHVQKNMLYAYNSDDDDQGGAGGSIGYGEHPPAIGVIALNEGLYATNKITYSPSHAVNYLSRLRLNMTGRQSNNQMNLDSQGNPTFFIYDGDPNVTGSESQYQLGETPADQKGTLNLRPVDLAPGETKCYHFAIVFADSDNNHLESVTELFEVADAAQSYYDDSIDYDCSMVMSSDIVSVEDREMTDLNLFPNPTSGQLYLNSNEVIDAVNVYGMDGRAYNPYLQELQSNEYAIDMTTLSEGVYAVQVLFENGEVLNRKVVRK